MIDFMSRRFNYDDCGFYSVELKLSLKPKLTKTAVCSLIENITVFYPFD